MEKCIYCGKELNKNQFVGLIDGDLIRDCPHCGKVIGINVIATHVIYGTFDAEPKKKKIKKVEKV